MFTLVWTSFVSIIAPILGTLLGIAALLILSKVLKSLGVKLDQQQMTALADAAGRATKSVEAWAAKKAAGGEKPSSETKAAKAVSMVKSFLSKGKLYQLADEKIVDAIEAKLGEDAIGLDDLVRTIHNTKKESAGN